MRTIVDIDAGQLKALDAWARQRSISRAEAVRLAVGRLLRDCAPDQRGFGLWAGNGAKPRDALALQRALRREWERKR